MLTVTEIRALPPGKAASDGGARGTGALWFKASRAGTVSCVFRYAVNRRGVDMPLGLFDATGKTGLSLAEARAKAGELSRLIQEGIPDPKAHLEEQARREIAAAVASRQALEAASAAASREAIERDRYTLQALTSAYIAHLERQGKTGTAKDVRSLFKVHLLEAAPALAAKPARDVTKTDLATRIREVRESGAVRTAGKLRSYLSAAFAMAARAVDDTAIPAAMIAFRVEANPVAGILAIPVKASERTLSRAELRAFLAKLNDNLTDRALRVLLFSGGQRAEQLLRARVSDYDPATATLRLWDPKGRRQQPREHRLPLGPVAAAMVAPLVDRARQEQPDAADPSLFANGEASLSRTTLSHRVNNLSMEMGGPSFILRDLRRTVETEMAALGFSVDLRAQLLSHGISGVQARHYDRHSYVNEKRAALGRWEQHLEGEERGTVVPMRRVAH